MEQPNNDQLPREIKQEVVEDEGDSVIEEFARIQPRKETEQPVITSTLVDTTVQRGEMIEYYVRARHATHVDWFIDDQVITRQTTGVLRISTSTNFSFVLELDTTNLPSSFNLKMVAWNQGLNADKKVIITVLEKPATRPEITLNLSDKTAKEGEEMSLVVETTHAELFDWEFNGRSIKSGEAGVSIFNGIKESRVTIDPVKKEHAGLIVVRARHGLRYATSHMILTVISPGDSTSAVEMKHAIKKEEVEDEVELTAQPPTAQPLAVVANSLLTQPQQINQVPRPPADPSYHALLRNAQSISEWTHKYRNELIAMQSSQGAPLPLLGHDPAEQARADCREAAERAQHRHSGNPGAAPSGKKRRLEESPSTSDQ